MSRYQAAPGDEATPEPGSHGRVLRNSLHIRSKRAMDRAEYDALVTAQQTFLKTVTNQTRFTAVLIAEMHRLWLGDIYPWAGKWRTVELQKNGFMWPPAYIVPQNMAHLESTLLRTHTPCPTAPVADVARRMAEVHAELLLIHPFREGNGRLARWLAGLMAQQAGLPSPLYRFGGRGSRSEQERYLRAVIRGYGQNYDLLTDFFLETIERRKSADPG